MRRIKPSERGSSLIVVVVLLMLLTALGVQVISAVNTDQEASTADRAAQDALYIAEAGIAFGMDRLRQPPFEFVDETADIGLLYLDELAPRVLPGPNCPDETCPILGWHQLTNGTHRFAGGSYWVVVADDEPRLEGDLQYKDTNGRFLMRSLGTGPTGVRKLLEVTISAPGAGGGL